jgi:hypothetical protein
LAPASADPYPKGTLHVGIGQGQENARSYLRLSLSALPAGVALSGGTLTATVGGTSDGSQSVGSAAIVACLVPESFDPSTGGFDPPPVDCSVKSQPVSTGSSANQLTVDLAPFVAAWTAHPEYGLALLPADDAHSSGASWHVALEGQGDTEPAARPITANVILQQAQPAASSASTADSQSAGGQPNADTPSQASPGDQVPLISAAVGDVAAGPPAAPISAGGQTAKAGGASPAKRLVASASLIGADGGVYSAVWLVPLGLVLLAAFFAFALTHEIRVDQNTLEVHVDEETS